MACARSGGRCVAKASTSRAARWRADEGHGPSGRHPRQAAPHHDPGQGRAVPAGQGEPAVPGARARTCSGSRTSPTSPPGRASSTWPSSSTPMRAASSAGGSAARPMPASFSMPWNRPCTSGRPVHRGAWCITATAARNMSIRYTERLAEAGIEPSVGSVGDSYDNALAETINGLFKAEVIHRRGPWRSFEAVEYATLNGSTGSTTAACWSRSATSRRQRPRPTTTPLWKLKPWPRNSNQTASGKPGAVQRWKTQRSSISATSFGDQIS
jgi:hypothetical protein